MIDFAIDKLLYAATRLCSAGHLQQSASSWRGQFSYFVRGRSVRLRIYFGSLVDWAALHSLNELISTERSSRALPLFLPSNCTCSYSATAGFACLQNLVISSNERPLVSGTSQATRIIVKSAPALKTQKVPSNARYSCMIGNIWFPR